MKINKPVVLAIALLILSWMFLENKVLTDRRIKALEASIQHQPPPANETILKFGDWLESLTVRQGKIQQNIDALKEAMEWQNKALRLNTESIRIIAIRDQLHTKIESDGK